MIETFIIKRNPKLKPEPFSETKLKNSILAACYAVRLAEGAADDIAERVVHEVRQWLINKGEVTSADLRREAAKTLTVLCPEGGYLYEQNKTII